MLWHCGLLEIGENKTLALIRRHDWNKLPADVAHELGVWLAMPGFSSRYHADTLGRDRRTVAKHKGRYEDYKAEVVANWLSASREDCLKLGYNRPSKGSVPLLTQLQIRRDYVRSKGRWSQKKLAEEYFVSPYLVNQLCWSLPDIVEELPPEIRQVVYDDKDLNLGDDPRAPVTVAGKTLRRWVNC